MENTEKGAVVVLERLREKCARFAEDERRQQNRTLDDDFRLMWTRVLACAGCELAAQTFLAAGVHDDKAQCHLAKYKESDSRGTVRCSKLGCNRENITACFEKGIRTSVDGEMKNSPAEFIRNLVLSETEEQSTEISKTVESPKVDASNTPLKKVVRKPFSKNKVIEQERSQESMHGSSSLVDIGFEISPINGKVTGINENRYARHLLTQFDLVYSTGNCYYRYNDGVWRYVEDNALSRILRDTLHEYVPDFWKESIERRYMAALAREAPYVNQMDVDRRYLNLSSGMLDLETLPHVLLKGRGAFSMPSKKKWR